MTCISSKKDNNRREGAYFLCFAGGLLGSSPPSLRFPLSADEGLGGTGGPAGDARRPERRSSCDGAARRLGEGGCGDKRGG